MNTFTQGDNCFEHSVVYQVPTVKYMLVLCFVLKQQTQLLSPVFGLH